MRATTTGLTTYPCLDCGTRGGYIPAQQRIPSRYHGLCSNCLQHHRRAGTLDRYIVTRVKPEAPTPPTNWQPPKLRNAAERKAEKLILIAMRVAMHEGGAIALNAPLVEGEDNTARRIRNADRFVAAYAERQGVAA